MYLTIGCSNDLVSNLFEVFDFIKYQLKNNLILPHCTYDVYINIFPENNKKNVSFIKKDITTTFVYEKKGTNIDSITPCDFINLFSKDIHSEIFIFKILFPLNSQNDDCYLGTLIVSKKENSIPFTQIITKL